MTTTTNLQEEIAKQINIGFSKEEIEQNLLSKGYTSTEINEALSKIDFSNAIAESNGGKVSGTSIAFGIVFIVGALVRFARFLNGGSVLAGLGVLTAGGMAIYYFTKRS
ncbi:hypothetical protein [Flavisolibacter tropicus]|uniref:Uncharacterized protein n=1 Tax=Flavisolibacter tropicus TaxID=1492898 RepID=A0A172TYP3_9BACT|nr:hypothetical protein [Flavisolibacter tropicus]ANE52160.1 hypothetical protein SY85_18340 [Flavisolibacter tropicus]